MKTAAVFCLIYISASAGKLANFFKTKNAQKGIGWVIDFIRCNICDCFEAHSCAKLFHLAFITLCTNKFLNKIALEIYRDFKITKEEDYGNGEIELTLQLKDKEENYPYVVTCDGSKFVDNKFSMLMNDGLKEFLKNISLNRCLQYAIKKKN